MYLKKLTLLFFQTISCHASFSNPLHFLLLMSQEAAGQSEDCSVELCRPVCQVGDCLRCPGVCGHWIVMMANGQADANNWPPVTFSRVQDATWLWLANSSNAGAQHLTIFLCVTKPPFVDTLVVSYKHVYFLNQECNPTYSMSEKTEELRTSGVRTHFREYIK